MLFFEDLSLGKLFSFGGEECSYDWPLAGLWIKTSGVCVVFVFVLLFVFR